MLTINIDTREKIPLDFSSQKIIDKQVSASLPYGDYCCEYNKTLLPVVFDRKSLGDLFGTLGKGHKRFMREVGRAKADKVKLIIIVEKSLTAVRKGYRYSKMPGLSVLRQLFTLLHKHDVGFVTCKNREEMEMYIAEYFYSYVKNRITG